MNPEDKKRNNRLNIRLHSDMTDKLDSLSIKMGIASSTLGAIAIAEYVNAKMAQTDLLNKTAILSANKTAALMERMMTDPVAMAAMASAVETAEQRSIEGA